MAEADPKGSTLLRMCKRLAVYIKPQLTMPGTLRQTRCVQFFHRNAENVTDFLLGVDWLRQQSFNESNAVANRQIHLCLKVDKSLHCPPIQAIQLCQNL